MRSPRCRRSPTRVHVDPAILAYISHLAEESARHVHTSVWVYVGPRLPGLRAMRQDLGDQPGPHLRPPGRHQGPALPIMGHRLILEPEALFTGVSVERITDDLLAEVAAPTERV